MSLAVIISEADRHADQRVLPKSDIRSGEISQILIENQVAQNHSERIRCGVCETIGRLVRRKR
jgi:hypothetical protein